jgi:hypothetical protein
MAVKSFITLAPQPLNSQTGFWKTILIGKTRGYKNRGIPGEYSI